MTLSVFDELYHEIYRHGLSSYHYSRVFALVVVKSLNFSQMTEIEIPRSEKNFNLRLKKWLTLLNANTLVFQSKEIALDWRMFHAWNRPKTKDMSRQSSLITDISIVSYPGCLLYTWLLLLRGYGQCIFENLRQKYVTHYRWQTNIQYIKISLN